MIELLSLPPIQRALATILCAGISFPIVGVVVVHLNLITLRFAMMHGAILGGAIGLALGIHPLPATAVIGLVMVVALGHASRRSGINLGALAGVAMAVTVAIVAALVYRIDLPARDTLSILWGNIYALRDIDLALTATLTVAIIIILVAGRLSIMAVLYDRETARTAGVAEAAWYYGILIVVAFTVALAMRLVGALLLDVLLLLPALAAGRIARSMRGLFVTAAVVGLVATAAGFFLSLAADLPASSGVAAASLLLFLGVRLLPAVGARIRGGRRGSAGTPATTRRAVKAGRAVNKGRAAKTGRTVNATKWEGRL